ncbi:MAG: hypothetical protein EA353_06430 [Puniceicoccaceae bacterium]|nr:MAG: hypothetical protein EA353_06430 [Puniceicoccaceae bacterium]
MIKQSFCEKANQSLSSLSRAQGNPVDPETEPASYLPNTLIVEDWTQGLSNNVISELTQSDFCV